MSLPVLTRASRGATHQIEKPTLFSLNTFGVEDFSIFNLFLESVT